MNHPDLAVALGHIYPDAVPNLDYAVEDLADGQGPRLSYFDTSKLGPEPTLGAIEEAVVAVHAVQTKARIKDEGLAVAVAPLLEGTSDVDQKWEMLQIIALKLAEATGQAQLVPPSLADVVNDKFTAIVDAGLTWAQKSATVDAIATDSTKTASTRKAQLDQVKFD